MLSATWEQLATRSTSVFTALVAQLICKHDPLDNIFFNDMTYLGP